MGYRDIWKSTCKLLAEVPAGSRINFEGLAFASKAILRKETFGCCGQTPSSTPSTEQLQHFGKKNTDNPFKPRWVGSRWSSAPLAAGAFVPVPHLTLTLAGTGGCTPAFFFSGIVFTGRMSPNFLQFTDNLFYVPSENLKTLTHWHLTYDVITRVMSGGKYVPWHISACNLRVPPFLLVIWRWTCSSKQTCVRLKIFLIRIKFRFSNSWVDSALDSKTFKESWVESAHDSNICFESWFESTADSSHVDSTQL